ncbi:hypothetical protein [Desulfobacula sp.]|uniref:hypothetical protein n=1 Tax=Desulfobacula sp. TaxID=2593537 RepID=UPI0025C32645|nr:hypothetical protein [Desulfobacula sp.]MBC2703853.1 hypothetical protein [Desulfobacula sp.]
MGTTTVKMLSGIILSFLGMALTGCTYSEIVRKDTLIIPMYQTKRDTLERVIVYGISFEHLNTILRIKKFGIQHLDKTTTRVIHGLSYALEYNEISSFTAIKLTMLLKRYHFDSLMQFTKKYSTAESILPDTDFKAIPQNIGQELFFLAQDNHLNDPDSSIWPTTRNHF